MIYSINSAITIQCLYRWNDASSYIHLCHDNNKVNIVSPGYRSARLFSLRQIAFRVKWFSAVVLWDVPSADEIRSLFFHGIITRLEMSIDEDKKARRFCQLLFSSHNELTFIKSASEDKRLKRFCIIRIWIYYKALIHWR